MNTKLSSWYEQKTDKNMGKFYLMTWTDETEQMLKTFDFELVHKIMELENWKWGYPDGIDRIPTIEELKHKAIEILEDCIQSDGTKVECGGFIAQKEYDSYRLSFCALDWYSHIDYN